MKIASAGLFLSGILSFPACGEESAWDVQKLASQIKPSLVTVINAGREGTAQGLGTGFIISNDGLVVTNLHVVGEARPIAVETQDGGHPGVEEVVAWSREDDLIIFRLAKKDLPALVLAPAEASVTQGAKVVAMGNPLGLRYSVVDGVVSEVRKVDGQELIQLAMPIERGNSGGPLVDGKGQVQGVISMKSALTDNLGYAVPIRRVQELLANPAPVKMANWLTIGALNPRLWKAEDQGTRWFQRAGRVKVEGLGDGFGGRSLCLWQTDPPPLPYEMEVEVKLDDVAGAAGLAFCCEETDVHYGFYPTAGKMRLTRFQGADVSSWTILEDFLCESYLPGEWNTLRVKVTEDEIICAVNGKEVLRRKESLLRKGRAGLCKFRQTLPEFRRFRLAGQLASSQPVAAGLRDQVEAFSQGKQSFKEPTAELLGNPEAAQHLLEQEAKVLELRSAELRALGKRVQQRAVINELQAEFQDKEEAKIDLGRAALLLARLDNPEMEVGDYLLELDTLAAAAKTRLEKESGPEAKVAALVKWLFQESGFHGSQDDFSAKSNSFLNEVIDDREGLPITLSVLAVEIARRLDLPLVGLPLPGFFMIQARPPGREGEGEIYDPFHGGKVIPKDEAGAEGMEPATKKEIILRMLRNLINSQLSDKSVEALPYLDALLTLSPDEAPERFSRALVRFQAGQKAGAREDVEWLLDKSPEGISHSRLEAFLERLDEEK